MKIPVRRAIAAACAVSALLAVSGCGSDEPDAAASSPSITPASTPSGSVASTPASTPTAAAPPADQVPVGRNVDKATAERAVRAGGLTNADVAPSQPRTTAPQVDLRGATLANLCDVKRPSPMLFSDSRRLARKQIWWTVAPKAWVSEERVVYGPGGVRAALADIRLAATRVCPKRIGTEPTKTAGLPAGSVDLWIKDARQTKQYLYAQAMPVSPNLLVIVWGGADSQNIHEIVLARQLRAMKAVVQRAEPAVRLLAG